MEWQDADQMRISTNDQPTNSPGKNPAVNQKQQQSHTLVIAHAGFKKVGSPSVGVNIRQMILRSDPEAGRDIHQLYTTSTDLPQRGVLREGQLSAKAATRKKHGLGSEVNNFPTSAS